RVRLREAPRELGIGRVALLDALPGRERLRVAPGEHVPDREVAVDVRTGGIERLDGPRRGDRAVELAEEHVAVDELAVRLLELGLAARGAPERVARAPQPPATAVREPH